ncbi:MAG: Sporulation related protein, partial [Devosia sp.]|nr:Sporulation related protein [Devosia sp.]
MAAKPQPMAGQSDSSDDLIAELAKLMAQDAQSDKPAEPSRPSSPVRIPGSDTDAISLPRFDFQASSAPDQSGALDAPEAMAEAAQYSVAPQPVEPFHFDFGLVAPKTNLAPASEQSIPAQVAAPSSPVQVVPDAGFTPADHDTIADLIAAELSNDPEPEMEAPAAPVPAPAPVVAEPRPAPAPSSRWSPSAVAANLTAPNTQERIVMRPVNLQPAPRPEQDRFKVAPVFGLGSGAPAAASSSIAPVVNEPIVEPVASATPPVADAPARTEPSFDWRQPAAAQTPEPAPSDLDDGIGRDPIDEIESLIGSAMRVELDRAHNPAYKSERIPSPALRSLATP